MRHVVRSDSNGGPGDQHDSLTSCWCVHKLTGDESIKSRFQTYPLFYLGLLLVEVGLDVVIVEVNILSGSMVKPEFLELRYTNHDRGAKSPIRRTLKDLEPHFGKEYYNATVTCLESTWTSQSIQQDNLKTYFSKVLYP